MALGLESNIAETAKAFQGNPQALQQRYTQKQDLFDLLALNMIKKQQAAAKNQLLMSQQKMPGTIMEQTEGAVTKNASEAAAGVKGVLDTKNAQSKANMNKMAGVASNPANNMRTLAGGGIVGFAAGKEVESKNAPSMLDDAWSMLKTLGTGLNKKELEDLQDKEGDTGLIKLLKGFGRNALGTLHPYNLAKVVTDNTVVPVAEAVSDFVTKPQYSEEFEPGGPGTSFKPDKGAGNMLSRDQSSLSGIAAVKPEVVENKKDKPVVSGVDSFGKDKSGGAPAVGGFDASKYAADDGFNTQVKGGIKDLLDSDPNEAVKFAARTPAEQAMIEKLFKERTDMRDNRMNPDKLSSDRLSQMLLGAKGATAGEAFRTAGIAGINADKNVESIRRSEFDAINKLFMDEANKSQGIKQKAFEGSQADKKQGVASGTSLTANEKIRALEADKLTQKISNDKIANSLRGDLNGIQEQRNSIMATGNTVKSNTQVLKLYKDTETKQILAAQKVYEAEKITNSTKQSKERADLDRKAKERMDADIAQIRKSIAVESKPFEISLKALSTQTGGTSTGGFKTGSMKVS